MIINQPFIREENINIIGTANEPGAGYDWSTFGVFINPDTKQFFYAKDSGCSCNSPWDNYTSGADLTPATPGQIITELRNWAPRNTSADDEANELIDEINKTKTQKGNYSI